jgi:hypothetical protein
MGLSTKSVPRDPRDVARAALLRVEEQLAMANCSAGLREAWTALVEALALGPAPELRDCPSCGNTGMRAATRCGSCWVALHPPDDAPKSSQ